MSQKHLNEDYIIAFSARVIKLLKAKMSSHNKTSDNRVSLSDLKSVFKNAADSYNYAGYSRTHWALARVNTFLRVKNGEQPKIVKNQYFETIGGLMFETKEIKRDEFDISFNWVPSTLDFTIAQKEMNEEDLDFHFSSSEDLYLEDYKPLEIKTY